MSRIVRRSPPEGVPMKWLLLIAFIAGPLVIWAYDRFEMMHWVGYTDLEVEFAITDAATGGPIPGARVEVQSDGGFFEEQDKREFTLIADTVGVARKECRQSMCFGSRSGLGLTTDTFGVHLPWWRFRAVAGGYEPSECTELGVPQHLGQVQRPGAGRAKLVVPVLLARREAEPAARPDQPRAACPVAGGDQPANA
jgi:hypothetical protein